MKFLNFLRKKELAEFPLTWDNLIDAGFLTKKESLLILKNRADANFQKEIDEEKNKKNKIKINIFNK